MRSSVPCVDVSKDADILLMARESADIDVAEAEDYMDVIGNSTPVHCGLESEGITYRESVSHAFL